MTEGHDHFGAAFRWAFQEGLNGMEVCKARHAKHEPCHFEPATDQEVSLHAEIEAWKEIRHGERKEEEKRQKQTIRAVIKHDPSGEIVGVEVEMKRRSSDATASTDQQGQEEQ